MGHYGDEEADKLDKWSTTLDVNSRPRHAKESLQTSFVKQTT